MAARCIFISILMTIQSLPNPQNCTDIGEDYSQFQSSLICDPSDGCYYSHDQRIVYVDLIGNYTELIATGRTIQDETLVCDDINGCEYRCHESYSCFLTTFICESPVGCNIICDGIYSCSDAHVIAASTANDIVITCEGNIACYNMDIDMSGQDTAHLHCVVPYACQRVHIYFDNMDINSSSSVSCYEYNSCDNLILYADGPWTQLNMYTYSYNVQVYNHYGYSEIDETIQCGLRGAYIQYQFNSTNSTIEKLVHSEYYGNRLPCQGVTIFCDELNSSRPFDNCSMEYAFDEEIIKRFGMDSRWENSTCANIELIDVVQLYCAGNCIGSPSVAPTSSPTVSPTNTPSLSPTETPSINTYSPSVPPSAAPTPLPTISPTLAPSQTPTIAPSSSPTSSTNEPTLTPSLAPSYSPSIAPSGSPTQAPTRDPTSTIELSALDYKIDIVYILTNLSSGNYNLFNNYTNNNVIDEMRDILERNYYHSESLSKYQYFQITITKINGIDINSGIDKDRPLNLTEGTSIYIRSCILFEREYGSFIIQSSKSTQFLDSTTIDFRVYFSSPNLDFMVANSSELEAVSLQSLTNDETLEIILLIATAVVMLLLITICYIVLRKKCECSLPKRGLVNDESGPNNQNEDSYDNHNGNEHRGEMEGRVNDTPISGELDNAAAPASRGLNDTDDEETAKLNEYRMQFRQAVSIVGMMNNKNGDNNKIDYNQLTFVLQENNIRYDIIEEVIQYTKSAQNTGSIRNKCLSDIDRDSDSDSDNGLEMVSLK